MIDWSQYGIELSYNATTCAKLCNQAYTPTIANQEKIILMLAALCVGLAVLLMIKGKSYKQE